MYDSETLLDSLLGNANKFSIALVIPNFAKTAYSRHVTIKTVSSKRTG